MIREIDHVAIRVNDIGAVTQFYAGVLGGRVIRDFTGPEGKPHLVYIQIGAGVVELIHADEPASQGYDHLAFLVDEGSLDTAYSRLMAAGFAFTRKPGAAVSGIGRLAFFKDASGILYELIERAASIRQGPSAAGRAKAFDHLTLSVRLEHWAEAETFFTELLGFSQLTANSFRHGADTVEFEPFDDRYPGIRCLVFQVESCEGITAELDSLGYDIKLRDKHSAVMRGVAGERLVFIQR